MPNVEQDQRGQVVVFFALVLPVLLALSAVVVGLGNWFVHAKHLQTKVDASALAAGSAWAFPCTAGSDAPITNAARDYAGPHTDAGGALHTGGYNEQVGGVTGSKVQVRLNANDWFDDDAGVNPADFTTPSGAVCPAKELDVKATEVNSFPLASFIPLFPDLKREARVQIQEAAESAGPGLLPLAVRVPKPLNAAAVYVNETPGQNFGQILSAVYFNDVCEPPPGIATCITGIPAGLGLDHWTTDNGQGGNVANIASMPARVGVVIALSHRPKCSPGPTSCFAINQATIDQLCNQGTSAIAQCYYTTGTGTQTFRSGLQFIRSYGSPPPAPDPAPDLQSVWLEPASGTNCFHGYFSAPVNNPCNVTLRAGVHLDAGTSYEIRYKLVSGNTSAQDDTAGGPSCNHNNFGGGSASCLFSNGAASVELDPAYARHAFAIQVRLGGVSNWAALGWPSQCAGAPSTACSWFWTGLGRSQTNPTGGGGATTIFDNPVQRAFMGDLLESGPVKYLHLKNVECGNGNNVLFGAIVTGEAASVDTSGGQTQKCFRLEMGLQGALAREQDEYPIVINIGTTSQSAVVDCDPDKPNIKTEIEEGCGTPDDFPTYKAHDFAQTDGSGNPYCPDISSQNQFFLLPKPAPYDNWAPFTCVLTQTSAAVNQVVQGFHQRIFGVQNNPSCPADADPDGAGPLSALFVRGRNYWHDRNNVSAADPDGAGPLDVQEDFYTFTRSGRFEPRTPDPEFTHSNRLRLDDPRFVLLFISPYNSFTGNGNDNYPITAIGGFYITGYGRIQGNGNLVNEDPCSFGAGQAVGAGNTPPPDVDYSNNGAIAWGHFVVAHNLAAPGGGNGNPCQEGTPTSCVSVLVR